MHTEQATAVTLHHLPTHLVLKAKPAKPAKAAKQVDPLIAMRAELQRLREESHKAGMEEDASWQSLPEEYRISPALHYVDPYGQPQVAWKVEDVRELSWATMNRDEWYRQLEEFQQKKAAFDAYRKKVGHAAIEAKYSDACNASIEFRDRFFSTPAISTAGLMAQVKEMAAWLGMDDGYADEFSDDPGRLCLVSMITALRRLLK